MNVEPGIRERETDSSNMSHSVDRERILTEHAVAERHSIAKTLKKNKEAE